MVGAMVPMVSDGPDLGGWVYVSMASAGLDWCLGLGGRATAPMVPDVWIVAGVCIDHLHRGVWSARPWVIYA